MNEALFQQLFEADRQGQRAIGTLWPGDQFQYRKIIWTVHKMQWDQDRRHVLVTTTEPSGPPSELTRLDGTPEIYQPRVMFRFDALLLFTAFLTDEHAGSEQEQNI